MPRVANTPVRGNHLQSQCSLWHGLKLDHLRGHKKCSVKTRKHNFETLSEQLRKKTHTTKAMSDSATPTQMAYPTFQTSVTSLHA